MEGRRQSPESEFSSSPSLSVGALRAGSPPKARFFHLHVLKGQAVFPEEGIKCNPHGRHCS